MELTSAQELSNSPRGLLKRSCGGSRIRIFRFVQYQNTSRGNGAYAFGAARRMFWLKRIYLSEYENNKRADVYKHLLLSSMKYLPLTTIYIEPSDFSLPSFCRPLSSSINTSCVYLIKYACQEKIRKKVKNLKLLGAMIDNQQHGRRKED
uniref:Uncharacterized protein n=1 Tax=Glossina pallidipes TaxID=7398 RepID=A0A1A9ZCS9_GLOPL